MKKIFPVLLIMVLFSACVKNQKKTPCNTQVCTDIFAYITVKIVDKNNQPTVVSDYKVLDLRTNMAIKTTPLPLAAGTYLVADDSDLKQLSVEGDSLQVTATDSVETKKTIFKVSGGICACHVTKIAGPDTIKFN